MDFFSEGILTDRIKDKLDKIQYWKLPFTFVNVQKSHIYINIYFS